MKTKRIEAGRKRKFKLGERAIRWTSLSQAVDDWGGTTPKGGSKRFVGFLTGLSGTKRKRNMRTAKSDGRGQRQTCGERFPVKGVEGEKGTDLLRVWGFSTWDQKKNLTQKATKKRGGKRYPSGKEKKEFQKERYS